MIPYGPICRELRQLVLATFPDDMSAPRAEGENFSGWIENGNYVVARHDSNAVFLAASPQDFSQALLRDVEFLVDTCFEQLLEIQMAPSNDRSPAWSVVTTYYYAFYAAQAFSRIIGMPITYLDDTRVSAIKALSPTPISLGAGSYVISQAATISVTQAEYRFKKSKLRPHDAVWTNVMELLNRLRCNNKPAPKSTDVVATQEYQLFEAATSSQPSRAFEDCQFNWPSEVRYEANYRVGNAYTMLRTPWDVQIRNAMRKWGGLTTEGMVKVLKESLTSLSVEHSTRGIKSRSVFLLDVANLIFAVVRYLLLDLHDRRETDWKWEDRRRRFFKKHSGILGEQKAWLFPNT